ncbi:alpha/beta hydrolase [Paraflavitalea speifideaquila]|uniref:alpha/beta fold hydrolase n=1 Tax=Paraflavitalea speifideaquila TaxID=3076558 RepID=UPI0028EB1E3C|nr:alpha/beta hydrolase [Paraflavitalea speifideiaquila]
MIREIFTITTNLRKCLSVIEMTKATQRNYIGDQCKEIKVPTLILWGKNDRITPPAVAESFNRLIPHSTLQWIDKCGHAPMMEQPVRFNALLEEYLTTLPLLEPAATAMAINRTCYRPFFR